MLTSSDIADFPVTNEQSLVYDHFFATVKRINPRGFDNRVLSRMINEQSLVSLSS
jgi:hypothetical protein